MYKDPIQEKKSPMCSGFTSLIEGLPFPSYVVFGFQDSRYEGKNLPDFVKTMALFTRRKIIERSLKECGILSLKDSFDYASSSIYLYHNPDGNKGIYLVDNRSKGGEEQYPYVGIVMNTDSKITYQQYSGIKENILTEVEEGKMTIQQQELIKAITEYAFVGAEKTWDDAGNMSINYAIPFFTES